MSLPEPGAEDSRHPARRVIVQDMTIRAGSGEPGRPGTCDAVSAGAAASLIAAVLVMSERPAALLLEELAQAGTRAEMLDRTDRELSASEHYRLEAGLITFGHCRTGLLRTEGGIVVAETELVILPQRLPAGVRAALARTRMPASRILAPLGARRLDRRAAFCALQPDSPGDDVAVESSAVLAIGNTKIGIAAERITRQFCQLVG